MALMTALTVGEGAFAFSSGRGVRLEGGGCGGTAAERTPKYLP